MYTIPDDGRVIVLFDFRSKSRAGQCIFSTDHKSFDLSGMAEAVLDSNVIDRRDIQSVTARDFDAGIHALCPFSFTITDEKLIQKEDKPDDDKKESEGGPEEDAKTKHSRLKKEARALYDAAVQKVGKALLAQFGGGTIRCVMRACFEYARKHMMDELRSVKWPQVSTSEFNVNLPNSATLISVLFRALGFVQERHPDPMSLARAPQSVRNVQNVARGMKAVTNPLYRRLTVNEAVTKLFTAPNAVFSNAEEMPKPQDILRAFYKVYIQGNELKGYDGFFERDSDDVVWTF
jgi:hypothetical protein